MNQKQKPSPLKAIIPESDIIWQDSKEKQNAILKNNLCWKTH